MRQARSGVPISASNTPTHQHTPISEKDGSFLSPDPWCVLVCGNPTSCCGRVRLVNAWASRPSRGQRATFVVGIAQRALAHGAYQPLHALLSATPVGCKAMHPCTTHTFTAAACPATAHDCTPGARTTQPRRDRHSPTRDLPFAGRKDAATSIEPELQRGVHARAPGGHQDVATRTRARRTGHRSWPFGRRTRQREHAADRQAHATT